MKKKVIALTLVVFTLLSMFPVVASASELIELTSNIANIEMSDFYLDSDHTKPLGENAVTKDTEIFAGLSVAFNEDNQPASESTEYNYIFPAEINMTTVTNGILYDGAKPAGTYTIANGEVRFNFYDSWLKTNSSAIKTSFDFSFKVSEETIGEGGDKTIVFPGIGEITLNTVNEVGTVSKRNSMASFKDDGTIEYEIELNIDHDVKNASLTDYLAVTGADNSNASYVAGSFKLDGTSVADGEVSFGGHSVQGSVYPSFTYPASRGIALSAGTHKLTYKVKYNDNDLFNYDTVRRFVDNTAKWTLDGNDTDPVTSTVSLINTPVAKSHSQITIDPVTNKKYVEWTITVNDGNAPIDMSNAEIVDNLWGNHGYSDLANSLKVFDGDGNDVTSRFTLNYTDGYMNFSLLFPSDAGRQKYTVTYRTELGDKYETSGYNNRALIENSTGNYVTVTDGVEGIGLGDKRLDYTTITSDMLSNGGGEYGQADWVIQINGPSFPDYKRFELNDFLTRPRQKMWYKRSTNAYSPDVTPDIPRVYYTDADGLEKELTFGIDYNVVFRLNNSEEMFYLSFNETAAVKQAFEDNIYIKYSTQSLGEASPGAYGNYLEFYYYNKFIKAYNVKYNVDEQANLYKEVSKVDKQNDGSYRILWNAIVNGNNTDGIPTSPNMEINGENIIISDTLPAGTKLVMDNDHPERLQFRVAGVKGENVWDWDDAYYGSIASLSIVTNNDGMQTFTVILDTKNLWKPNGSTKYLVYLRYLTETEAFAAGEYGSKTVTNRITAQTDTRSMGNSNATAKLTNAAVDKTAEYIAGSGNQVKYTIHVNDGATEINEGNPLSLWDQFDPSLSLVDGTLKIYLGDTSTELEGWNVSGETVMTDDGRTAVKYTLSNLPDSTHLRVEYNTTVTGEIGETVIVDNTAALVGHLEHSSTVTKEVRIEKCSGQASGASGKIEILKLNSENINEKLKGAEFNLYSVNLNSGVHSLEAAKISDEDGLIVFDRNASGSSLMLDTLYCYQETKAPVGYVLDDTKYYFMLKGDNYSSAFPRAVELLGGNIIPSAGNSFSMFNTPEKKTLLADKIWKDYQGNVLSGEILAEFPEITLNVIKSYTDADNQVHSEQFEIKLNNGNNWHYEQVYNAKSSTGEEYTYSVSELAVDSYLSDVSINESEDRIEICAVNTEDFVPVELPETGGSGEMNFISIGLSLIAIGLLSGFMLKKSNLNSAKIKKYFHKERKKTMKNIKKIAVVSLAVIMLLCTSITAFYADDTSPEASKRSIVITNPKKSNHTYEAFQVFSGKVTEENGKKTITDIQWGNGVNGDALLAALKEKAAVKDLFMDAKTAADAANVLSELKEADDSAKIDAVAAIINSNVTDSVTSQEPVEEAGYKYTIEVDGDGYYFVRDKNVNLTNPDAVTKFILQVAGEKVVDINVKTDFPDVDKDIVEGESLVKVNNASIGDTITYQVSSAVPDMTHYKTYFFQIQDTMEAGLTLDETSFTVEIGDEKLDSDDYVVTAPDGGYTFTLRVKEFIKYKQKKGQPVIIRYAAVLNENAEIGTESNDNTVNLKFSNNPNLSDGGTTNPNEPSPENPTGVTPDHTVKTYTSAINILKLDGATNEPLTGVEFTITGENVNTVVLVTEEKFTENAEGNYYKLTDGTYTTTAPTEETIAAYDSTETKYKKTVEVTKKETNVNNSGVTAAVDENGIVKFIGLGAGEYKIEETKVPKGYQKLSDVNVKIAFNKGNESWDAEISGPEKELLSSGIEDGIIKLTLENNVTVELPSTGGAGVVMFYVIGGILVAAALFALIALRKRSSKR